MNYHATRHHLKTQVEQQKTRAMEGMPPPGIADVDEEDFDDFEPRRRSSAIRLTTTSYQVPAVHDYHAVPRRRAMVPLQQEDEAMARTPASRRTFHPLVWIGGSLLVMLVSWICLNAVGAWWQNTQDTWHYGNPRTYQVDAVVGQNDSASAPTHFIAENLDGQILVIQIPRNDLSKAHLFPIVRLFGDHASEVPVTLSFQDRRHDGKPDMLVQVGGQTFLLVNDQGTFRQPRSSQ